MLNPDETLAIDELFTYHPLSAEEVERLKKIGVAAKALAYEIVDNCPRSADCAAALRKLREAVMTANASIALPRR